MEETGSLVGKPGLCTKTLVAWEQQAFLIFLFIGKYSQRTFLTDQLFSWHTWFLISWSGF